MMRQGPSSTVFGSNRAMAAMIGGNQVSLLRDGAECFPAMLQAIESAEREILLEMYWFASDRTGRRFAGALMARARDGLRVRVIYDAVGSFETEGSLFEDMRRAGCLVREYHPIAFWRRRFRLGVVNSRDHRKMLVVDGRVGFTGGINLGDQWASEADGGQGWRDDMIRIEGPAVAPMRELFELTWSGIEGAPRVPSTLRNAAAAEGDTPVRVLANRYAGERRAIRRVYLDHIRAARRTICLANSYFVPDRVVRRSLARAAGRGVDVRVMVPGESDLPAVQLASRRLYSWLLRRGVKLYEWQGSILHSKSAVIDGIWCAVGTFNLDWRSWRFNLEMIVAIHDEGLARAMEKRFVEDLGNATPVQLRDWRYRPLSERVLEWFFYLFRKLL